MSNHSLDAQRPLPKHPNVRRLKDEAKDLLRAGKAQSITEAQFKIARTYGFASWPKLKAHVDSLNEVGQLKEAIDNNDLDRVTALMTRNPALHRAALGYGNNGPLTWVAECRVPWEPPAPVRLAMAEWMIQKGSDVHQGGDGPLMRAALRGERAPMMELLVRYGADVNAQWNGNFPILFAPCETVDPVAIGWLVKHGADPNCSNSSRETALDYLLESYERSPRLGRCMDLLRAAGGRSKYELPGVMETVQGRVDALSDVIAINPEIVHRRFPELNCGSTAGRRLLLKGATLLHVAAEYGSLDAAKLLISRGAEVNARATTDDDGVGGQTPIFHAVTQFHDHGFEVASLLVDSGADISIKANIPGHYERPDEVLDCTPLGFALRFPGSEFPDSNEKSIALLRARGAKE